MKSKVKRMALLLAAFFILFNTWPVFGVQVRLDQKIEFSAADGLTPLKTQGFCLTEDELFITPNQAKGRIEISEINGSRLELINVIGRKGFEFLEPTFCCYNQKEGRLAVLDFGKRKILTYDRLGRNEFKRTSEIPCLRLATDIQLMGEKEAERLLIAGYMTDENGNPFDLYEISADGQITPILSSFEKYGLKSNEEYEIEYRQKPNIKAKGINSCFDVQGDDVYFAWEANYKIIKLNLKSRQVSYFGQKPRNYVEPAADKLVEAFQKRNNEMMKTARESMSYIAKVFTTDVFVLVIFAGPFNQANGFNYTLQLYDLNGKYLGETAVPGQPEDRMHFDKGRKILYSLLRNSVNSGYIISKYMVSK
ncbi:MAG TPA: hypothetical protein VK469_00405 [Candidatus Kapabacteria bacterium]|nr:hypothetical protein [Candidatus Kapabacteria bacterium]